jgi:hypothetical protein
MWWWLEKGPARTQQHQQQKVLQGQQRGSKRAINRTVELAGLQHWISSGHSIATPEQDICSSSSSSSNSSSLWLNQVSGGTAIIMRRVRHYHLFNVVGSVSWMLLLSMPMLAHSQ